jgi:hypothetical protein
MCAGTKLLIDSSSVAVALSGIARDPAAGGLLHLFAGVSVGVGFGVLARVAVIAALDPQLTPDGGSIGTPDVRFTRESGHLWRVSECLLRARTRP